MPLLTESYKVNNAGTFTFSAVRPDQLQNTAYTLVTIAVDKSGSVGAFRTELIKALQATVDACKKDPMAENLLLRVLEFNQRTDEIHSYKPLNEINVVDYQNHLDCDGMTSLYDATFNAVGATNTYAQSLTNLDMDVNGVIFIITDGCDNRSSTSPSMIEQEIHKALTGEHIASLTTILVGVNIQDSGVKNALEDFKKNANLNEFVDVGNATPQRLAKLAAWVSKSVSSVSSSLGQGSTPAISSLTF